VRHLQPLCHAYAALSEEAQRAALGRTEYSAVFGRHTLPGKVKKKLLKSPPWGTRDAGGTRTHPVPLRAVCFGVRGRDSRCVSS